MYIKIEDEIASNWKEKKSLPLVSVVCPTYGHEAYIEEALDSVLMQQTDFQFEIIVGEDKSPDNTRKILIKYQKRYPNIIKLILHKKNKGAINNIIECIAMTKGKYIAILDGDDFWVDKLKLQKQVDFLEKNVNYGLVYSDLNHLYEDRKLTIEAYNRKNKVSTFSGDIYNELLTPSHIIKTVTVCFRKELLEKYYLSNQFIMKSDWKFIDISIWLMFAKHSKIYYLDEVLATYRLLPESMSSSKNFLKMYNFYRKIAQIRFFYLRNSVVDYKVKKEIFIWYYREMLKYGYLLKNKRLVKRAQLGLNSFKNPLNNKEKIKVLHSNFF